MIRVRGPMKTFRALLMSGESPTSGGELMPQAESGGRPAEAPAPDREAPHVE